MTRAILRGIEVGLLAVGAALAVWCAAVLVQAELTQRMPVPEPSRAAQHHPVAAERREAVAARRSRIAENRPAADAWRVVARLEAPSVKMRTTVLEGSDDRTLDRGAGHIEDTPLPGQIGNIGIAGHRDTVFRPFATFKVGDPLELTTRDRVYRYRISTTTIVDPKDVHVLDPTPSRR